MNMEAHQIVVAAGLYVTAAVMLRRNVPSRMLRAIFYVGIFGLAYALLRARAPTAAPFVLILVGSAMIWVEGAGVLFRLGLYRWEILLAAYAIIDGLAPGVVPTLGSMATQPDHEPIRAWILDNTNDTILTVASRLPMAVQGRFIDEVALLPVALSGSIRGVLGVGTIVALYGFARLAGDVRGGTFVRYGLALPLVWVGLELVDFTPWDGLTQTIRFLLLIAGARLLSIGAITHGPLRAGLFVGLLVAGIVMPSVLYLIAAVTVVESVARMLLRNDDTARLLVFGRFGREGVAGFYHDKP